MGRFSLSAKTSSGETPGPSAKERVTKNWHLILTLAVIVAVAFILRAFFAYDVAVAGGYGLSGGSDAAYHLRVIESIMTNWGHVVSDPAMNYPYGEINVNPPLMDWVYAILASIVTVFGVSTEAAATGVLVWATPVLGALTCIPVYYLAREMFDHKVGIISALLYTICAIAISQTVLSNGTEAAFYGFFFVWMVYFLYKAVKAIRSEVPERKKGELGNYAKGIFNVNRPALRYAVFASIMLIVIELSWNGFRPIILMIAFLMIVQVIMDRIKGKDPTSAMLVYGTVLVLSTLVCAPIYALVDLWSLVYSGSFFIVVFAVLFALVMSETKGKPWVLILPILIAVVVVIFAVLWFALPDLFSDIVSGNSIYTDPTFVSLVGMNSSASLSAMAGYYGWFTLWLPYVLIALMIYKFSDNTATSSKTFVLMWFIAMMAISLTASNNLFLAAPAYMIGAGAVVGKILERGDLPAYVASFKGVGLHFKGIIKKIFQPAAFASILVAVFLVVTPNAMYAIDAATPSNDSGSSDDSTGAFGYYVKNNEDWKMNDLWDHYAKEDKSGSMVSWWDYSAEAAAKGGFESVAGANGSGAAAASNILLAQGGAAANIAMTVRLLESNGITQHEAYLVGLIGQANYDELVKIMSEPDKYIDIILKDPTTYGTFSTNLSAENAMYIAAAHLLHDVAGLTETQSVDLYDTVCIGAEKKISYIVVSRGMFPIAYGDGSVFNTLAYMNNYYLDQNGSPTDFYTYASSGYYTYTAAMYETLIWKAYIGPSPSDMGYTSATTMFNAFALSDGSENTVPQPGFGLSNYVISYWQVLYNADPEASTESDGWVPMDAYEAQVLQRNEGGLINYMTGLPVVLEYIPGGAVSSGKVTTDDPVNPVGIENARVSFVDGRGIQKATVRTDKDGNYTLRAHTAMDPGNIQVHMGSENNMGGLKVVDSPTATETKLDFTVDPFRFEGTVYYEDIDDPVEVEGVLTAEIEGKVHGIKDTDIVSLTDKGKFTFNKDFIPDTYTVTIKDEDGNTICTATYEPMLGKGDNVAVKMFITSSTVTVNLTDEFGSPLSSDVDLNGEKPFVMLTGVDDGKSYNVIVKLENGKGTAKVAQGTYKASLVLATEGVDGKLSYVGEHSSCELFNQTVTVASSGSATLNAKAQPFVMIDGTGMADVSTIVITNASGLQILTDPASFTAGVKVPVGSDAVTYYVYGKIDGGDDIRFGQTTLSTADIGGGVVTVAIGVSQFFEFSKVLRTTTGGKVEGKVEFYPGDDPATAAPMYVSATTVDGMFSVRLVPGDYVVHAYSSNSSHREAFIGRVFVHGDSIGGDIQLVEAKTLTVDVLNSTTGSGKIPYVGVTINDTANGISFETVTNDSGTYSKYVPANGTYTLKVNKTIGAFTISGGTGGKVTQNAVESVNNFASKFVTSSVTNYGGILTFEDQDDDVLAGIDVKMRNTTSGSSELTFKTKADGTLDLAGQSLPIGSYTITIEKSSGYHYSGGNVTLYISNNDITIDVVKLDSVEFTALGENDKITVDAIEVLNGTKGVYYSDDREEDTVAADGTYKQTYYFESGKEFQVKITRNADDVEKVYYHFQEAAPPHAPPSTDTKPVTVSEYRTISGYAGYPTSGILVVENSTGVYVKVPVSSSGKYTVDLPDGAYDIYAMLGKQADPNVADSEDYRYLSTARPTTIGSESKVVNLVCIGAPAPAEEQKIKATVGPVTPGVGNEVTFDVGITGNDYQSLFLAGGADWHSITFYSLADEEIDHINGNSSFKVKATYKEGVSSDSSNLSIIFKTLAGKEVLTTEVGLSFTVEGGAKAERGENDNYGDNEYKFAVSINNESNKAVKYKLSNILGQVLDGWYLVFTDSEGTTVVADDLEGMASGQTVTNIYVKLVNNGNDKLPESFKVNVFLDDGLTPTEITITPATTAINIDDGGATGPNIFATAGSISMTIWAMVAGSILLFVLILWLGMKRGVFTRRR